MREIDMGLLKIQQELKAPKNNYNSFGKYNYRSCEDILNAVKPLLKKNNCHLYISDEVVELSGVIIVVAKATFIDADGKKTEVTANAGVDPNKKGMDISQSFGASSSYARKYALNGLFLIDDTKDADTDEYKKETDVRSKNKQTLTPERFKDACETVKNGTFDKARLLTEFDLTEEQQKIAAGL